jgi:hypothetical protein
MCKECGCEGVEETQRESASDRNVVTSNSVKGNSN